MTFSIVAYDTETEMCGVAVSTRMPAIGGLAVFARSGAGAIATQALINPLAGADGLDLLRRLPAEDTLSHVRDADPAAESRQIAVVDSAGRCAVHTGTETHPWSGHRIGNGYVAAGNMLVGEATVNDMAERYERSWSTSLPERLLTSLEAGQKAGGDRRGKQSAALYVHSGNPYPYLDLRVDEHVEPVVELRRIYEVAQQELLPFSERLPTRAHPEGHFDRLLDGDGP
ncbi:DUF1028 domain-containing protein [Actinopolyspora sp. H202]|uniref:DUF1028 domain-containing protein n=1 Tax=Actinopolyspora sp. H202 TaxID=1500456 RepID=UPI003EE66A4A